MGRGRERNLSQPSFSKNEDHAKLEKKGELFLSAGIYRLKYLFFIFFWILLCKKKNMTAGSIHKKPAVLYHKCQFPIFSRTPGHSIDFILYTTPVSPLPHSLPPYPNSTATAGWRPGVGRTIKSTSSITGTAGGLFTLLGLPGAFPLQVLDTFALAVAVGFDILLA